LVLLPNLNVRRKAFHLLVLVYALIYLIAGWLPAATVSLSTLVFSAVLEVWRLRSSDFPLNILTKRLIKPQEEIRVAGYFYFVLAAAILIFLFPEFVVVTSLVVAGAADAVAALVGSRWGKHFFKARGTTKSFEGLVAGSVSSFILTLGTLYYLIGFFPLTSVVVAVVMTALDYFTPPIDDNLLNPLSVAVTLTLCRLVLLL